MESLGGDALWIDRFLAQHAAVIYYWVVALLFCASPKSAYAFGELVEAHATDTYCELLHTVFTMLGATRVSVCSLRGGARDGRLPCAIESAAPCHAVQPCLSSTASVHGPQTSPTCTPCSLPPVCPAPNRRAAQFVEENEQALRGLPPPLVAVQYYRGGDLYYFDAFQTAGPTPGFQAANPGSGVTGPRGPRRPECNTLYDVFSNIRDDEVEHVYTMQACQDSGSPINCVPLQE